VEEEAMEEAVIQDPKIIFNFRKMIAGLTMTTRQEVKVSL
jgi:hypothetical protein